MVSLVLPPLTQLNTPYPSLAYLARFLRERNIESCQYDLGISLVLRVFSRSGLAALIDGIETPRTALGWHAVARREQYLAAIDPVIAFLQGKDRTVGQRILRTPFLPDSPRTQPNRAAIFGNHTVDDAARHLATGWLSDLAELVATEIDEGFALSRYHHALAAGIVGFDALSARLARTTLIDAWLDELAATIEFTDIVGISVPFPGNLYGALRVGRALKQRGAFVVLGGGYVNTELREVNEPRLWSYIDALTYDDGESPLLALVEWRAGRGDRRHRTRMQDGDFQHDFPDVGTTHCAWYGNLPLDAYLQLVDGTNPAHRLWSDGRWNKFTLAHGCYWKKCSFCDVNLDYIARYAPAAVQRLTEQVREVIETTGVRGFHAVDEAAPPRAMRDFAIELLASQTVVNWWGNIRFEQAFTPDLCRLLAASGLVAVTGGLEVASDRLLAKMDKGVSIEQVTRVAAGFGDAGVLVHAYLMYGFPTQTDQETIDSMEIVRQLFALGLLKSAFWHRFVLTRHSAIYPDPKTYGIRIASDNTLRFAQNDVDHDDPQGGNHDQFDEVLPRALHAWMRGEMLEQDVRSFFSQRVPASREASDRVQRALSQNNAPADGRALWLGGEPLAEDYGLRVFGTKGELRIEASASTSQVIGEFLVAAGPAQPALRWSTASSHLPREAASWLPLLREGGLVIV